MLNGTLSFLQKYLFLLLSFHFYIIYGTCSKNVQVTSLSPQNHFITKPILFFEIISSIIVIRSYSAYDMFNSYHNAYQINQEKVQKSLLKSLFIVMKFQAPSPSYPPHLSSA